MVECDVFYDYTSQTVSWIRRDNREVAERREMTHKELQMDADSDKTEGGDGLGKLRKALGVVDK